MSRAHTKTRSAALDAMDASKHAYKRFCLDRYIDALGVAERPEPPRRAPTAIDRVMTFRFGAKLGDLDIAMLFGNMSHSGQE